jgi:hypothetical protein
MAQAIGASQAWVETTRISSEAQILRQTFRITLIGCGLLVFQNHRVNVIRRLKLAFSRTA